MMTIARPAATLGRSVLGLFCAIGILAPTPGSAQGTAFTYQGVLEDDGHPANGSYDFRFAVWTLEAGGSQAGSTVGVAAVAVSNGQFTALLDFGAGVFTGPARWLEVQVQPTGGGGYTTLAPRARLTPSPYAVMAATVPAGAIGSLEVADNSLTAGDLASNSVGASEIATAAVGTSEVADNSLTAADLASDSVGASELADNAVSSSEVINGSLTGADLADNTVGSAQLADSIALGSSGVDGALAIYSASNGNSSVQLLGGDQFGGRLWLYSNDRQLGVWMAGGSGDAGLMQLYDNDGHTRLKLDGYGVNSGGEVALFESDGSLAVELASDSGGRVTVKEDDASDAVRIEGGVGGQIYVNNSAGHPAILLAGTAALGGYQQLYAGDGSVGVYLTGDSDGGGLIGVRNSVGLDRVVLDGYSTGGGGSVSVRANDGTTTVEMLGDSSAAGLLVVRDNAGLTRVQLDGESTGTGGEISVFDDNGTETVEILGAEGTGQGGQILLRDADGNPTIYLDGDFSGDGRVTTDVLEITGGSDLSEQFDVAAPQGEVRPGMVVCIDPQDPGRLILSSQAYDRTVAGVISGGGGVKPGMLMGQRGTVADGQHPVALSGRVYCLVDASMGAIEPGDLITTSDVPGYGMKVSDHARARGSIIGKAMTPLGEGRGLVLMLVTLQ